MADGGVLQTLVSQERNEMIPKDATNHRRHNSTTKLVFNVTQLVHQHAVVLFNLWMRTLLDFAHLVNALNHCTITQIERKHVAHAGGQILSDSIVGISIKTLYHHTHINKIWGRTTRCLGYMCEATWTFPLPDAVTAPMGLIYQYGRYNKCHLLWRHRRTAHVFKHCKDKHNI